MLKHHSQVLSDTSGSINNSCSIKEIKELRDIRREKREKKERTLHILHETKYKIFSMYCNQDSKYFPSLLMKIVFSDDDKPGARVQDWERCKMMLVSARRGETVMTKNISKLVQQKYLRLRV